MDYLDTIDSLFSNLYNKLENNPEMKTEMDNVKESILFILVNKNKTTFNLFESIKPMNYSLEKE